MDDSKEKIKHKNKWTTRKVALFKRRFGSKNNSSKNVDKNDPLKWFNRIMFLFGLSISVKNYYLKKCYHRLHGFFTIIHAMFVVITYAIDLSHSPRLYKLDTLMYCLGQIVYTYFIIFYGQTIYKWIQMMAITFTSHERKVIQVISIVGLIPIFIDRISFTTYSFYLYELTLYQILDDWIFSLQVNYIMHTFVIYILLLVSFFFYCSKLLDTLKQSLNPLLFIKITSLIKIQLHRLNRFASLPFFILFPYMFIALPATASQAKNTGISTTDIDLMNFLKSILMLIYIILIIITVLIVIVLRNKLESKRMEIMYNLVNSYKGKFLVTVDWEVCIERLYDEKLFDFSVFSLFSLDFSLLMTYSFAVITFSIFLFEMDNNIHKNNKF